MIIARRAETARMNGSARRRSLIFVKRTGKVSESLLRAAESEFSNLTTRQVPDLECACRNNGEPGALLLIDPGFLPELERSWPERSRNAALPAALMFDESHHSRKAVTEARRSRWIRGVVPMNLKLDVWLSVLALLLRGGDYFPPWMFRNQGAVRTDKAYKANAHNTDSHHALERLTDREIEILEMIARGDQNKVIAAKLGLSEHTVKVHVHNIIDKLGIYNRTAALSIYLEAKSAAAGQGRTPR